MTVTDSGYAVIPKVNNTMNTLRVEGVSFGQCVNDERMTVFEWVGKQFNDTVSPLRIGQCGCYSYRDKRGGVGYSNHASSSAIDCNTLQFPQGKRNMSVAQIAACRKIVANSHGAIGWGGEYGGVTEVDQQHFEAKSVAAMKSFAAFLKGQPQEDEVTPQDIDAIANKVVDKIMSYQITYTDAAQGPNGAVETVALGKGANNFISRLGRVTTLTQDWVRKIGVNVTTVVKNG